MPITTLPTLSRTATTFKADVDTFFGTQLPAFATEANALETNVNAKEASAVAAADTASTKAGEATTSASNALASKNAAALSATAALNSQNAAATSAGTATTQAGTATTKAAEAAASAASVVRDGSGGVAGLTLFKLNLRNAANTFTSFLTNAATAARTWAMQDRDGTVALLDDITGGTRAGSFTTLAASGGVTVSGAVTTTTGVFNTGSGAGQAQINNFRSGDLEIVNRAGGGTKFYTGQTVLAATLDTDGKLIVGINSATVGGAKLQTADGITFPANQVYSEEPNTLDDYERGSFTATLRGTTGGTYNFTGTYVKVGRIVYIGLEFTSAFAAGSLTGNLYITGLPFSAAAPVQLSTLHIRGAATTGVAGAPFGIVATTGLYLHPTSSYGSSNVYSNQPATYPATALVQNGVTATIASWSFSYRT